MSDADEKRQSDGPVPEALELSVKLAQRFRVAAAVGSSVRLPRHEALFVTRVMENYAKLHAAERRLGEMITTDQLARVDYRMAKNRLEERNGRTISACIIAMICAWSLSMIFTGAL